jgi:hypothetical protein
MTEEERGLVMAMVTQGLTPAEFLKQFRFSTNGQLLCGELLSEAIKSRAAQDVEWSLIVGYTFGFTEQHLEPLLILSKEPWHFKHEDVVTALGKLKTPKAVDGLLDATKHIPIYLDFDESRALAVKAIWALGGIEGSEADAALKEVMSNPDPILVAAAEEQLKRRKEA